MTTISQTKLRRKSVVKKEEHNIYYDIISKEILDSNNQKEKNF